MHDRASRHGSPGTLLMSRCAGGVTRTLIAKQLWALQHHDLDGHQRHRPLRRRQGQHREGCSPTGSCTRSAASLPAPTPSRPSESQVITAEACRDFAHCGPPTGRPRAMQHWQACRKCPHAAASAPRSIERAPCAAR
ncbi:hypothetical protein GO496_10545 [Acidovorax citrulli]|nr:hypothetical protein [Paracidovorax citrulli]